MHTVRGCANVRRSQSAHGGPSACTGRGGRRQPRRVHQLVQSHRQCRTVGQGGGRVVQRREAARRPAHPGQRRRRGHAGGERRLLLAVGRGRRRRPAGDAKATPKECAQAARTGFDSTVLANSPAAAVTFKVDANDVSEVLVSSPDSIAATALAGRLPAACAHFKETADGKTLTYTATESTLTGVGQQARVLNVQSSAGRRGRPVVARLPGQGVRRRGDRGRPQRLAGRRARTRCSRPTRTRSKSLS